MKLKMVILARKKSSKTLCFHKMIVLLVFQSVHEKKEIHAYRSVVQCKTC